MRQPDLELLSCRSTLGALVRDLEIAPAYDDDLPLVNFAYLHFAMLESLTIRHQGLESMDFAKEFTPTLQHINLDQCVGSISGFNLDLPELRTLGFDHITVCDPAGFGPSLDDIKNL